ncbi:unnamed protein product [Rotaria magnacalcarata]|uniref:HTH CENPB-type domain-containing protein n=1 Tax=Rotaria magnacalcarata TaxID=392030 RepID=A0A819QWK6_9BILA|nr:unnamed protein product [Rotaria magnacalcarata]
MSYRKKGTKRKRLNGGGNKLTYIDLDSRLFAWYREKRTAHASTTNVSDIRKEKVTFRQLERQGRLLSEELNYLCPSSKWFDRFLVRHRLSLQRPKRQQKIPLEEVHQKATSFFSFLRRASRWAPKRGTMCAFTPRDIFSMDESPFSLFGGQTKRSVNDINTCNEVEGCLSNKRFCTVILTISGKDQRVGPVLLFKGMGRVSAAEDKQYAQSVKVFFTPKCVINKQTMDKYNDWFISKVQDSHPKMLTVDSAVTLYADSVQIPSDELYNLKCFSLTSYGITSHYDVLVVSLLRRMTHLEKLTLYLRINVRFSLHHGTSNLFGDTHSYVDQTHFHNNVFVHMPQLHSCKFSISTEDVHTNDIQRTFTHSIYGQTACIIDHYCSFEAIYHVYSLPFQFTRLENIRNQFPNIMLHSVTHLSAYDMVPMKHEFFMRISRAFPTLKCFTLVNETVQTWNQNEQESDGNSLYSVIEYLSSYITSRHTCT